MTVSIKVVGTEEVVKKLQQLWGTDLKKARDKRLRSSAILIEWEAKKEAPVKTGILRKYIRSTVYADHAVVFNNVAYALPVHEWQKPHEIVVRPSTKQALFWKGAKHPIRGTVKIRHPWAKANPFFDRAINNKKTQLNTSLDNIINTLLRERFWW